MPREKEEFFITRLFAFLFLIFVNNEVNRYKNKIWYFNEKRGIFNVLMLILHGRHGHKLITENLEQHKGYIDINAEMSQLSLRS